ncbi:MAG: glycoside hydrolase family 2 protein [Armatimonadota bacterium]
MDKQPMIDLCGDWNFAYSESPLHSNPVTSTELSDIGLNPLPCTVPGNFELDLQKNGLIDEPFYGMNIAGLRKYESYHIWYFRRFSVDLDDRNHAEFVFEGIDCFADIYLNGKKIGSTGNMLIEHVIPVDNLLTDNELFIYIRPALHEACKFDYPPYLAAIGSCYESLYVRKAPHMYGWDIMPRALSAGIWRRAYIRFRPQGYFNQLFLQTISIAEDKSSAYLLLNYDIGTDRFGQDCYSIQLTGSCGDSRFEQTVTPIFKAGKHSFGLANPVLWWPRGRGDASIYDVTAVLLKNGSEIDRREFKLGIRTVRLDRTSIIDEAGNGEFCFRVNGEKVFIKGTNWVPLDAYHSRDIDRLPDALDLVEDIGCNMIRCWGGNVYENDLFYDICDEKGILVWQDFTMACAKYPQDSAFQQVIENEARSVVRRLRQHPCLALWCGDNECDMAYSWNMPTADPNENVLTRKVLSDVVKSEDPSRPYLPSSPYIDAEGLKAGDDFLTEYHLWGPRGYYKDSFYTKSRCCFASEMGYHGSPSPDSIKRFISPEKVWPYTNNDEWILHSTSPIPGVDLFDYRVELMASQIRHLFGEVPGNLDDYCFVSQGTQGEAMKFFVEMFRTAKWRRTGLIWWNILDGWPQFSDAVVDYYFDRKLAYYLIKTSQKPLALIFREPDGEGLELTACNDTRDDIDVQYTVWDAHSGDVLYQGSSVSKADSVTSFGKMPYTGGQRFFIINWKGSLGSGRSHYLAGDPPFDIEFYRSGVSKLDLPEFWWQKHSS